MNREQFNKELVYMSVMAKVDSAYDVLVAIEPTFETFSEYDEIPVEYLGRIDDAIEQVGDLLRDMEQFRNERIAPLFKEPVDG